MKLYAILAGECLLLGLAFLTALVLDLAGCLGWQPKWRA